MNGNRGTEFLTNDDLIREGARVAVILASRRSQKLLRLFNFLLERSRQGSQVGEAEIIGAVLGEPGSGDEFSGSSARIYISRLRKMLDQYYEARPGPRLVIPRGGYRIELINSAKGEPEPAERPATDSEHVSSHLKKKRKAPGKLLLAAAIGFNLTIACVFWITGSNDASSLDKTKFWQSIASGRYPTIVVVGDHFLFGEQHDGKVDEIVRDFAIRKREDFRKREMIHRNQADALVDLDLNYISSNIVFALRSLLVATESLNPRQTAIPVVPASQMDPSHFKNSNIIYAGSLDGLGHLIGNLLFRASAFALSNGGQQLIDKRSHRIYRSDLAIDADTDIPLRDYGYIASLPGPSGNRILIVSGLGDAGIAQMADLAASKAGLAELASQIGGHSDSFEALYQVRAMYSQSYGRKLIAARAISDQGIWDVPAQREISAPSITSPREGSMSGFKRVDEQSPTLISERPKRSNLIQGFERRSPM